MVSGSQGQGEPSPEIAKLAKVLAKDPKSKVFMQLAEEYLKAGLPEEAVPILEEGLKHYPTFVTARVILGRAYDQLGDTDKARAILEEAVRMSPDNLAAHRILAKIYMALGVPDKAAKSCEMVLAVVPKDEEFLALKASLGGAEPPPSATQTRKKAGLRESAAPTEAGPGGQGLHGSDNGELEQKIAALQSWLNKIQQRRS